MLAELAHVLRHAPATLALKRRLSQDDLYATLISRADAAGLAARRDHLVEGLHGHIAEIGCGTGAMFARYHDVEHVTAIEPDPAFAAHARRAALDARVPITVLEASGEAIPLADASVDAVVVALVLCSVPAVDAVCAEIARIVRPGGEVRLIEHVRSPKRVTGLLMDVVNPLWLRINGQGCRLNRDPRRELERAGLSIECIEPFQIWSAGLPAFPMRLIFATRSPS
jgi:ubiquinone/menaquinone biosynthesis C-methylase UbiE